MHLLQLPGLVCFLSLAALCHATPIRLATGNYPPYEYEEAGEIKGLVIEVLREAFRRNNQSVEFQVVPWARALWMAEHGEVDGVFATIKTPEREKTLVFSNEPVVIMGSSFFIKKGRPIVFNGNINSMSSYQIGILRQASNGPIFDNAVRTGILKNIDLSADASTNIKKLIAERNDVMVGDTIGTVFILKQNQQLDQVTTLNPALTATPGFVAFTTRKDLRLTREALDQTLKAMKKDGSYQRIIDKYAKDTRPFLPAKPTNP